MFVFRVSIFVIRYIYRHIFVVGYVYIILVFILTNSLAEQNLWSVGGGGIQLIWRTDLLYPIFTSFDSIYYFSQFVYPSSIITNYFEYLYCKVENAAGAESVGDIILVNTQKLSKERIGVIRIAYFTLNSMLTFLFLYHVVVVNKFVCYTRDLWFGI